MHTQKYWLKKGKEKEEKRKRKGENKIKHFSNLPYFSKLKLTFEQTLYKLQQKK